MEHINIGTVAAISFAIIVALFWYDYHKSACGYGGSDIGKDNWALRFIRKHLSAVKRGVSWMRKPQLKANEYSDFKDVFSL